MTAARIELERTASEARRQDYSRIAVGVVVCLLYGTTLGFMLYTNRPGVDILVGALAGAFGVVVAYWYNASKASDDKAKLATIARQVRAYGPRRQRQR